MIKIRVANQVLLKYCYERRGVFVVFITNIVLFFLQIMQTINITSLERK